MAYPGMCNKYGPFPCQVGGFLLPGLAFMAAAQFYPELKTGIIYSEPLILQLAGATGVFAARGAHNMTNRILHDRSIGLTRGAAIVRKVQALTYAATLTATFAVASSLDHKNHEAPASPTPQTQTLQKSAMP